MDLQRIEQLRQKLHEKEAIAIISPVNRRYYTDFLSSNGMLFITKNDTVFYTDFRYITAAENVINKDIIVKKFDSTVINTLKNLLSVFKLLYIETTFLTYNDVANYKKNLEKIELKSIDSEISSQRMVKDENEIESIKNAQKITDSAFVHIIDFIASKWKNGLSEREIAMEIEFFMRRNESGNAAFDVITASGINSSMPHAIPTDKKICSGDFITMDFGATFNGYCSDMTRTVAIEQVSDEQTKIYEIVLTAQKHALNGIKAGIIGKTGDSLARDYISEKGFGEFFGHSLGHSLGLEIHENPNFNTNYDKPIPKNAVMSVEPGIYLPNKFGVRIEDIVVLRENGIENLTKSEKKLLIL